MLLQRWRCSHEQAVATRALGQHDPPERCPSSIASGRPLLAATHAPSMAAVASELRRRCSSFLVVPLHGRQAARETALRSALRLHVGAEALRAREVLLILADFNANAMALATAAAAAAPDTLRALLVANAAGPHGFRS